LLLRQSQVNLLTSEVAVVVLHSEPFLLGFLGIDLLLVESFYLLGEELLFRGVVVSYMSVRPGALLLVLDFERGHFNLDLGLFLLGGVGWNLLAGEVGLVELLKVLAGGRHIEIISKEVSVHF